MAKENAAKPFYTVLVLAFVCSALVAGSTVGLRPFQEANRQLDRKRTILRGVRLLCAKRCRTAFAAHYLMDSATQASRVAHLAKVSRKMDRFLKG